MKNRLNTSTFWLLFTLTIILIAAMRAIDPHLTTTAAPAGIVSFEFAGNLATAWGIMESWAGKSLFWAGLSMGIDFFFLAAYAATIACGCLLVSQHLAIRWPGMKVVGRIMAGTVLVAGLLDIIENIALIKLLAGSINQSLPKIAAACAGPKFILVGLSLVYVLAGFLVGRLVVKQT